ncbi:MAG: hypothetical protein EBZ75_13290 [Oxalobacteraceae bacterium]|nr:hypothetical protein [Oxalobacteraceae bacterium]
MPVDPSKYRTKIEIPNDPNGKGIANIKIAGNTWNKLNVEIGGQVMNRIHRFMGFEKPPLTDNGHCIPFVEHHAVVIVVENYERLCGEQSVVEYDIVECEYKKETTGTKKGFSAEFIYSDYLYNEHHSIGKSKGATPLEAFRVYFNHPVRRLFVKTEKPVESVDLWVDLKYPYPTIPLTKVSDCDFVLDFGKNTLNFSNCYAKLYVRNPVAENTIRYYVESLQCMRAMSGMYGNAFSK